MEKSVGLLSSHQHCRGWGGHSFSSATSAHPLVHQLPGQEQRPGSLAGSRCLAGQGSHGEGQQRDSLGFYSQLFLVPKKTGYLRPVVDLSTLNRHMVVPHFKMETQGSVRAAIRSQEWTASIDICNAYLHVPMHKAVRRYLRLVVNKRVYQFTCLPFGLATSPREFTKLLRPVIALLRQLGVKLHIYLDDWLIHTDTPKQARLHAQMTISVLQFLGWMINYKSGLPVHRDAVQHLTVHSGASAEDASESPVCSSTLDDNPVITTRDLHRLLDMVVFMATLVPRGRLRLRPVQC